MNTTPANGDQLTRPPTEIQMTFTESVNLVDDGIRLIDHVGATCPLPGPPWPRKPSPGRCRPTCRRALRRDLAGGVLGRTPDQRSVLLRGRHGRGHRAGSFTGTDTPDTAGGAVATTPTAPWPMVAIRMVGYLAFALFAGVAGFVLLCAPDTSKNRELQLLACGGLLGGAASAVAAILVRARTSPGSR